MSVRKSIFFITNNGAGIVLQHTFMQKVTQMDKLLANLKARFPELSEEDILLSVETMIGAMSSQLARGGRIELRGFGSFSLKAQAQTGYTPDFKLQAPELEIPLVHFKPGLIIREKLKCMHRSD